VARKHDKKPATQVEAQPGKSQGGEVSADSREG
jgi:hypothetical protein